MNLLQKVAAGANKHAPTIWAVIGIVGMSAAIITAIDSTPKAMEILDEMENPTGLEMVKKITPCYTPTIVLATLSAGCIIGSTRISARRNAALMAAYEFANAAYRDYKDATIEELGEKKAETIRSKAAEKRIERAKKFPEPIPDDRGEVLFYDEWQNRAYYARQIDIERALNSVNKLLTTCMYASLNDFYYELNKEASMDLRPIKSGDLLGWNIGSGEIDVPRALELGTTPDGRPCYIFDFNIEPRQDFRNLR